MAHSERINLALKANLYMALLHSNQAILWNFTNNIL